MADGNALAHEAALVVVRGAEGRDDHDILGRERIPEQGDTRRGGGLAAVGGVGFALVGLQVAQPAPKQVLVDEGIVDQLREHEDAAAGIFREGLVGPLDGVLHAEAEAEMARDHVADRAEVEDDRRRGRALMLAGDGLDRGAKLRLIECAGDGVLGVNRRVALLGGTELVDEIVFPEVQVGDLDEIGIKPAEECGEGRQEVGRAGVEGVEGVELHGRIGGSTVDLGEVDRAGPAVIRRRKIFGGRKMLGKGGLQPRGGGRERVIRKGEVEPVALPAHGQLVARVEREDGDKRGKFGCDRGHQPKRWRQ